MLYDVSHKNNIKILKPCLQYSILQYSTVQYILYHKFKTSSKNHHINLFIKIICDVNPT